MGEREYFIVEDFDQDIKENEDVVKVLDRKSEWHRELAALHGKRGADLTVDDKARLEHSQKQVVHLELAMSYFASVKQLGKVIENLKDERKRIARKKEDGETGLSPCKKTRIGVQAARGSSMSGPSSSTGVTIGDVTVGNVAVGNSNNLSLSTILNDVLDFEDESKARPPDEA